MKIAIGIASAGRPEVLKGLIGYLATLNADIPKIYVCIPDNGCRLPSSFGFEVKWSTTKTAGTCIQRNKILDIANSEDWLVFMDDDFLPRGDFFINLCSVLKNHGSTIGALTGTVIADGVTKGGLPFDEGVYHLTNSSSIKFSPTLTPVFNVYGCNMVINMNFIRNYNLRFDENLPEYGWLEDVEFSLQLKRFGRILKAGNCVGVHLGAPEGRQGAIRLGYSQISNPHYICLKHRLGLRTLLNLCGGRCFKNMIGALKGNTVRQQRLAGNFLAFRHLVKGIIDPRYIVKIT